MEDDLVTRLRNGDDDLARLEAADRIEALTDVVKQLMENIKSWSLELHKTVKMKRQTILDQCTVVRKALVEANEKEIDDVNNT